MPLDWFVEMCMTWQHVVFVKLCHRQELDITNTSPSFQSKGDISSVEDRGLHWLDFQARTGPAHMAAISARPESEIKILVRTRSGPINFFSDFGQDRLDLRDFKTGPCSWLYIINAFFVGALFFCNLLKQLILHWLLSAIFHKRTSYYRNTKN